MIRRWFRNSLPTRFVPLLTTPMLLLLLAGAALPRRALAQTDTAILMSLTPYLATAPAYLRATCSSGTCRMTFPPVPAGKRLLVTTVSLNTYSSSNTLGAVLTNGVTDYGSPDYRQINLPNGIVAKNSSSGFGYDLNYGGVTTFYIEAGYTPTIVYFGSVLTNEFAGMGTIVGVLGPAN